eukprot:TRINITY_DN1559_c0_g1_i3.p3 TRINITY_DN1559_c0_g1~~TRINITY_DN1559_c0_g1_i3.p3  ORF type:complete len:148 (+),score=26.98 TRINITY_DN1559_c0_g1_i3:55-498(+)
MSTSEETPMNRMGMSCDNSTVRAMAAFEPNADLKEWTFNPKPMNDDMVDLRITWSGVCHSDIHTIDGDWGACTYPCVPGHEIIGIVTEVGANVTDIKVGDRCGVGPMVNACQKDSKWREEGNEKGKEKKRNVEFRVDCGFGSVLDSG